MTAVLILETLTLGSENQTTVCWGNSRPKMMPEQNICMYRAALYTGFNITAAPAQVKTSSDFA